MIGAHFLAGVDVLFDHHATERAFQLINLVDRVGIPAIELEALSGAQLLEFCARKVRFRRLDILLRGSAVLEKLQRAVQGALSQNEIARGLARVSLSLAVIG